MQSELLKRYGQSRIDRINRKPALQKQVKSYYELLEAIVLPFVKNWQTDFTEHDAKALKGYSGSFIYAIRTTGTDIQLIEPFIAALNEVWETGKCERSGYFTPNGVNNILKGTLNFTEAWGTSAIVNHGRNDRFFIGKDLKIKEVTKEQMIAKIKAVNHDCIQIINLIRQKWQNQQPFPVVSNDWTFKKPEQPAWVFSQNSDH